MIRDWRARFWSRVLKTPTCWLWQGCRYRRYGRFGRGAEAANPGTVSFREIGETYAHRVAWVLLRGRIPAGMVLCHTCDNPLCVNPEHLWIGTQKDNLADMTCKGRRAMLWGQSNPNWKTGEYARG